MLHWKNNNKENNMIDKKKVFKLCRDVYPHACEYVYGDGIYRVSCCWKSGATTLYEYTITVFPNEIVSYSHATRRVMKFQSIEMFSLWLDS